LGILRGNLTVFFLKTGVKLRSFNLSHFGDARRVLFVFGLGEKRPRLLQAYRRVGLLSCPLALLYF
jgi:hypothetical protein